MCVSNPGLIAIITSISGRHSSSLAQNHVLVQYSLNRIQFIAVEAPQETVLENDDGGRTPTQPDEATDQLLLGHEGGYEDRMQIKSLAQHPRVVGQEEVVQDQVEGNAPRL